MIIYTKELANQLVELQKNVSFKEARKILNISYYQARKLLIKFGFKTVQKNKPLIPIQENYFEIIDTEDKAYFLGFIGADGCINDKHALSIHLQKDDQIILKQFLHYTNSQHTIKFGKTKNTTSSFPDFFEWAMIYISRKNFVQHLLQLNITPRKSLTLIPPPENSIPNHLMHHFIRGYFDGDGGAYFNSNSKNIKGKTLYQFNGSFTGTKEMLTYIESYLHQQEIKTSWTKRMKDNSNNYTLLIHGNIQGTKLYEYMYQNHTICLDRKLILFKKCKDIAESVINNRTSKYRFITKYPSIKSPWSYQFKINKKKYSGYGATEEECKKNLNAKYLEISGINLGEGLRSLI